jgi:hypothetical protein
MDEGQQSKEAHKQTKRMLIHIQQWEKRVHHLHIATEETQRCKVHLGDATKWSVTN